MYLKNSFLFLFLILLLSCELYNNPSFYGNYKSKDNSLFGKPFITGVSLNLNRNKTYVFTTCSQTTSGHWIVEKDKLFLYCENIRFNIDSLNLDEKYAKGTVCDSIPDVYTIGNHKLSKTLEINNSEYKLELYK
jgi:hypothetical protein